MEDTDEGKAFILAQAEARFANPPMALWDTDKNVALLDYHDPARRMEEQPAVLAKGWKIRLLWDNSHF